MKCSISIIIPTVNRHEALAALVESLLQLPTAPHEIVIVDQTEHVLGVRPPDLNSRHNCVRHIHLDAAGPCIARNTGANIATGDILWFLDDDMEPDSPADPLAYIVDHFQSYPESALVALFEERITDPESIKRMGGRFDVYRHITRHVPVFRGEYRFALNINAGSFAIPRYLFVEIGGFDDQFDPDGAFEDRDLGLRCLYCGIPVYESSAWIMQHHAVSIGGRRESRSSLSPNLHYFWSKYMSEDMYYLQSFSYWLTQPSRVRFLLLKLIKGFMKRIVSVPSYPEKLTN